MEKKLAGFLLAGFFVFLALARPCQCGRPITSNSPFDNVSDGLHGLQQPKALVYLNRLFSSDTCTETYGFLPCTTTVLGNVFLILIYSYLMFLGAKQLSDGSEILLEILGPGIIGGFLLPVLSSLPDATIILGKHHPNTFHCLTSQLFVD